MVYVVLVQDRHTDPEIEVFATEEAALAYAREQALDNAQDPESIEETECDPDDVDGWVLTINYGTGGDHVTVMKKEIQS